MDILNRSILFGGKAIVSALDVTDTARKAREIHGFSVAACRAFSKALTAAAFMSAGFKGLDNKLTVIIEGGGAGGRIVLAGEAGAKVRGYMEDPKCLADRPEAPVRDVVGRDGNLIVIKDFGLKEPYNGYSRIVNGSIDADFAYYFTQSEQLPSAVATGVNFDGNGRLVAAGGIIVQPMPNCDDGIITMLQDIVTDFADIDDKVAQFTPQELIEAKFGHFEKSDLEPVYPEYRCDCSRERTAAAIRMLGESEARAVVAEMGRIEVCCDFCGKKYVFGDEDVRSLFKED